MKGPGTPYPGPMDTDYTGCCKRTSENGVYANFAVVHHTSHEITIDFCQLGTNPTDPGQRALLTTGRQVWR